MMWCGVRCMLVTGLLLGWLVLPSRAAPAGTVITSERLEFDYRRSIAVFTGNVRAVDGDVVITANRLTVLLGKGETLKSLTAVGRVRITQGNRRARCKKAIYLAAKREVILSGDAEMQQGTDRVSGDLITVWLDEDRMECEPGRLVIQPQGKTGPVLGNSD